MAKRPDDRFQTPAELAALLAGGVASLASAPTWQHPVPLASPVPPAPSMAATMQHIPIATPIDPIPVSPDSETAAIPARRPRGHGRRWLLPGGIAALFLMLAVVFAGLQLVGTRPATESRAARPASPAATRPVREPVPPLFNGKNLEGWEGLLQYWSVKEGAIVCSTPGGSNWETFLCSKKKYKDFELRCQIKVMQGSGSGLQFRSEIANREKYLVTGPQCDLGFGAPGWGSLYLHPNLNVLNQAPPMAALKVQKNEYNHISLKCLGKHVVIKVNDVPCADNNFPTIPDEGIIALQLFVNAGPSEVHFKQLECKDLSVK
jgi:hypothetical protein